MRPRRRFTLQRGGGRVRTGRAAFSLTASPTWTEHDHQVDIIVWRDVQVLINPTSALRLLHATPNGGLRAKRTAGRLKAEGMSAGVPDLNLSTARRGFCGCWCELKTPERMPHGLGAISAEQRRWLAMLHEEGNYTSVAWGAAAGKAVFAWYLGRELEDVCAEFNVTTVVRPTFVEWRPVAA